MGVEDVASGGAKIARMLIPPIDSDPVKRFKYDATISVAIFFGGLLVTVHILWICGWLAFLSITPPFARADEMTDTKYRVVGLQASNYDKDMREAKTKICLAILAKNQVALDAWARILEGLKENFRKQIGREPSVLGCDELVIGPPSGTQCPQQ